MPGRPSGSDPLAELARLIGQNDPFAEYGRDGGRHPAPPQPPQPAPNWSAQPPGGGLPPPAGAPRAPRPPAPPPIPEPPAFNMPNYGRQPFGGANLYQDDHEVPGYPAADQGPYEADAYHQSNPQFGGEQDDFYEDAPRPRRRVGVLIVAGIFALAVVGTAGAFGYRALFGASGTSGPPPVIKAESGPSKIVPASTKDPQSAKVITDRVNDRGMGEKLVSREEQPVEIKDKPAGVVYAPGQDPAQSSSQPALGSGVIGTEPKRVRTIAIHPDQAVADAPAATASPPTAPAPVRAAPAPARAPPLQAASNPPPAADPEPAPEPRPPVARAAPPVRQAAAPSNAPLSLNPNAAPARAAAPPPARAAAPAPPAPIARTAAVAPTQPAPAPASASSGSFAVQVSSQRSEAEAQAAFRALQAQYPTQLGGKQPLIHRVDLGAKGIYYRAMVGPFASGSEAVELCTGLKAAGGQCIIQKN